MVDQTSPTSPYIQPSNTSSQQSALLSSEKGQPRQSSRRPIYIGLGVAVAAILIAGGVAGGVLGSRAVQNSRNNASNGSGNSSSGSSSSNGDPTGSNLSADLIDSETPGNVKTRTGWDGQDYQLVFSDEFNKDGRTFKPGDEKYWEAMDLNYAATNDLEWYDPRQITTRNGSLVITLDSVNTTEDGQTPGSTAPFTAADNHGFQYRSGMLQSWNKFCFTSGYIEVAVVLPGTASSQGYWPGVWTMGNLGRPGYLGSTDGMWPYSYDSCDIGTFPNQTTQDKQGPAAALHSDKSKPDFNMELSWLTGQRASACSCPGGDHPGPSNDKGRGAPEIDIFEARGGKVSQSAQFAPFNYDYLFNETSPDAYWIANDQKTQVNSWTGSPVQQAVTSYSNVSSDGFQGSGQRHIVYGFEYWANPSNRPEGFITWGSDGQRDVTMGTTAVGPDPATQISQRLVPEEPMSIIINLAVSQNWGAVVPSTMQFPAEMLVDYVRVYQRKDHVNVGCDPKDYPTADYINRHMSAYTNTSLNQWPDSKPTNKLYNNNQC